MRKGISLLEVLFAIFVLAVGLLALASMIPVGKHQVTNANNFDAAATIGRAAMSEIETRDLYHVDDWAVLTSTGACVPVHHTQDFFDPMTGALIDTSDRWLFDADGSVLYGAPGTASSPMRIPPGFTVLPQTPFAIDPLYIAQNWSTSPTNAQWFATGNLLGWQMGIPRITFQSDADMPHSVTTTAQRHALRERLAERIFLWQDDVIYDPGTDEDARPKLVNPAAPRVNQINANYSWLATFSPIASEYATPASKREYFKVSTVVFHKRNIKREPTLPANSEEHAERLAIAEFPAGGGQGGGHIWLTLPTSPPHHDYFHVRKNQWIMLIGRVPLRSPPYAAGTMAQSIKWYRVVSVANDDNPNGREITIEGDDWLVDADSDGKPDPQYAAIYDGVIGVHERNIKLDSH